MKKLGTLITDFHKKSSPNKSLVILVRKGESLSNYAGLLCGWLDPRLTVKGRQQANYLCEQLSPVQKDFKSFWSSDLRRCSEFADICLGFNGINGSRLLKIDKKLREINFGKDDGLHYDTLSTVEKDRIDSPSYKAEGGESWVEVKNRFYDFAKDKDLNKSLIFTHGGLICSVTIGLGLESIVAPGSAVGLLLDKVNPESSEIEFVWDFAQEELK